MPKIGTEPPTQAFAQEYITAAWETYEVRRPDISRSIGGLSLDALHELGAQIGFPTVTEGQPIDERLSRARAIAQRLVRHPTRTMDLSLFDSTEGIVSPTRRGQIPRSPYKVIQDSADHVSFTFGMPYIFNKFSSAKSPYGRAACFGIVVLNGDHILERGDLTTTFVDNGILHQRFNPISKAILELPADFLELRPTPLQMLYEYVIADPARYAAFRSHMEGVLTDCQLSPNSTETYIRQFLVNSFPLTDSDAGIARQWRSTFAPEGNVVGSIPPESIKWVVVADEDYQHARSLLAGTSIAVVAARGMDKLTKDSTCPTHDHVNLLAKYAETIGARDLAPFLQHVSRGNVGQQSNNRSVS